MSVQPSVFLASPSDLNEERSVVKSVVDELNDIVRQTLNVHLDLLTWENNAYPSVGIDAQDIINNQIGDEYDIFIGMMWKKFGTPTSRAGSGTEEEFNRAYEKFVQTKGATKIMIYFSSKLAQLDEIDVEQLGKIKEFKKRAQKLGVLHWGFNDADSFGKLLKMHLLSHVRDVKNSLGASDDISHEQKDSNSNAVASVDDNVVNAEEIDDDTEVGYLDLMEIFHENFAQVEKVLVKIGEHVEELGEQMTRKAHKLEVINKSPNKSPHSYRLVIDSSAADINNYVQLTNIELPRFHDLFTSGIDSFSNGLALVESGGSGMDAVHLEELLEAIGGARNNAYDAVQSIIGFRGVIENWPSVAKTLNKAVKLLRLTLSSLIDELTNSVVLLDQLKVTVETILSGKQDGDSGVEEV